MNVRDQSEVHRALGMYQNWIDWAKFLFNVDPLIQSGAAIEKFLNVQIGKIIEHPPTEFFATEEVVPYYNLPGFLISDCLAQALNKWTDCRYAVGSIHLPNKTIYSLRSRPGSDVDVSEIAKQYGGGGHKHAAGFSVTHDDHFAECVRLRSEVKELKEQLAGKTGL